MRALILALALIATPATAQTLAQITSQPPPQVEDWSKGIGAQWTRGIAPYPNYIVSRIEPTGERQVYVDKAYLGQDTAIALPVGGVLLMAQRMPPSVHTTVMAKIAAEKPAAAIATKLAAADWSSAVISSAKPYSFGYFEWTANLPTDPATFPAFWFWNGATHCELDAMEMAGDALWRVTIHDNAGAHQIVRQTVARPDREHTYGLLWTKTAITPYLDGKPASAPFPTPACLQSPMHMIGNLAIGGLAKAPDASTPALLKMQWKRFRYWAVP